jgi:uncharacterized protein (DUF1697 family)
MKKYLAFLRGINVGNIRIKMTDLKVAFENIGYKNVKTYLQTGNVVFESAESIENIKTILEQNLSKTFDYEAFVLLYEYELLPEIIKQYPFTKDESHHAYVIFIDSQSILEELKTLSNSLNEDIKAAENIIYWKVPKGSSLDTAFAKILAKAKYKANTTVRNINTLEKML